MLVLAVTAAVGVGEKYPFCLRTVINFMGRVQKLSAEVQGKMFPNAGVLFKSYHFEWAVPNLCKRCG